MHFTAAMCTSQCKLHSLCANARLSALLYTFRESLASLSMAMAFLRGLAPATNVPCFAYVGRPYRPCITATSAGLRAIRRTCVASLVFRQDVETNVNATVFRAGLRLYLSNYCLQHTSTIAVYMCQSGHH